MPTLSGCTRAASAVNVGRLCTTREKSRRVTLASGEGRASLLTVAKSPGHAAGASSVPSKPTRATAYGRRVPDDLDVVVGRAGWTVEGTVATYAPTPGGWS